MFALGAIDRELRTILSYPHLLHIPPHRRLSVSDLCSPCSITLKSFRAERLELYIAGTGSMDLRELGADGVQLSIAGAGEIDASGIVDKLNIHVSGLGAAALGGLASKRAT